MNPSAYGMHFDSNLNGFLNFLKLIGLFLDLLFLENSEGVFRWLEAWSLEANSLIYILLLACIVSEFLGKLFNLTGSQFSHLYNGNYYFFQRVVLILGNSASLNH